VGERETPTLAQLTLRHRPTPLTGGPFLPIHAGESQTTVRDNNSHGKLQNVWRTSTAARQHSTPAMRPRRFFIGKMSAPCTRGHFPGIDIALSATLRSVPCVSSRLNGSIDGPARKASAMRAFVRQSRKCGVVWSMPISVDTCSRNGSHCPDEARVAAVPDSGSSRGNSSRCRRGNPDLGVVQADWAGRTEQRARYCHVCRVLERKTTECLENQHGGNACVEAGLCNKASENNFDSTG